jgi:hypothetical protein
MTLNLNKFDITSIPDKSVLMIIGNRCSGKNTLCIDIIKQHENIQNISVVTHTNKIKYENDVPNCLTYEQYNDDTDPVPEIIQRHKIHNEPEIFILDNLHQNPSCYEDKLMSDIFLNRIQCNFLTIVNMQNVTRIPVDMRCSVDYYFIFAENFKSNRKIIYKNYAGVFPTFRYFCDALDEYTENYGCLVIKNTGSCPTIFDKIFWYRVED